MKEAYLYRKLGKNRVRCDLCSHFCVIAEGDRGICGVRQNMGGTLYSLVYRKLISENADPIEKKPLFHFLPGTLSLSVATVGCNFKCFFCQNYSISQVERDSDIYGQDVSPEKIVADALQAGCKSISYTYTEPTIFFEYAYDTARIAKQKGLKNIFVTNGFMSGACLEMAGPYLDAANVDLKAFSEEFYRERVGGKLKPVLENIKLMKQMGIWIEVTTLIIPGLNDSEQELRAIAEFLNSVSSDIPWHISAYYPQYKSRIEATSADKIKQAQVIGKEAGLKYVYGGNIYDLDLETTYCCQCGQPLIKRDGFAVSYNGLEAGKCPHCGVRLEGVF
ncbi:MAG: AmmeMemoRadiSam system radical SAM enzyme [Actinomycetota bacterium]|nr:AmmeMemoRadiSam system radical SAM enzyme [Actinomycetota bacterium]